MKEFLRAIREGVFGGGKRSQRAWAKLMHESQSWVSNTETGQRRPDVVEMLRCFVTGKVGDARVLVLLKQVEYVARPPSLVAANDNDRPARPGPEDQPPPPGLRGFILSEAPPQAGFVAENPDKPRDKRRDEPPDETPER